MRLRPAIILLTPFILLARTGRAQTYAACAAFAADGSSIAVTIDSKNVSTEITNPAAQTSRLDLPLRRPVAREQIRSGRLRPYSCQIRVDHTGGLVAIGITSGLFTRQLQVAVADLKGLKWIGDWEIGQARLVPPTLAGFLEDTSTVVVAGEPAAADGKGTRWGLLDVLEFDTNGVQIRPKSTLRYSTDGTLYPRYVDADHDRLWVVQCVVMSAPPSRQPLCPVASMSLTGNNSSLSELVPSLQNKKRTDLWLSPNAFAAPDSDTFAFAEGTNVWRIRLQNQTIDRLDLPLKVHFPNFAGIEGTAALSPDAEVIALPLVKYRLAFPFLVDNYVYQGTDIALVQLEPLQFLGSVPHDRTTNTLAFAVDHRHGKTTVLVYRRDHWERHELSGTLHP